MSTLLEQVAQPQAKSTKKPRKQRHSTGTRLCACGAPKEYCSVKCRTCNTLANKPPEKPDVFFIDDQACRFLPLTRNQYAIIDECEFPRVSQLSFHAHWNPKDREFRVYRMESRDDGKKGRISLAAFILGMPGGSLIDHANGNPLDNRRNNLRPATHSQNAMNRRLNCRSRSGLIGVVKVSTKSWMARMKINGKVVSLGTYPEPQTAAKIRDVEAIKRYGQFAKLNFPELIAEYHAVLSTKT